ncbi:MAG: hypothetical protein IMF11_18445 [Proteobacteria bacterium]|nr:hypothetical protein [Pseudomonadota bacterium]
MAGVKHDKGKLRIDLVPPNAILEVAEVLTAGVAEYGAHNWREGIAYSRLYAAIQRHLLAFWKGEDIDNQSRYRALAHACTDIMMLMEMPKEWDDRYVSHSVTTDEPVYAFGTVDANVSMACYPDSESQGTDK